MFLPTILAGIAQLAILLLIFHNNLKKEIKVDVEVKKVKSKLDLVMGLGHLSVCLLLLVISSYINISMWVVCLICALSLLISILSIHLIRHKKLKIIFKTLKRLPYELIPFVLSMFIIVLALKQQGITSYISNILGEENVILRYGITSFFACNLINNIPMSVLFANIPNMVDTSLYLKSIYSIIIGSNVGAFLTPIGALAGIMFTDLLNRQQVEYNFTRFIKYGMIIAIPTLLVALLTLNFMI
jgi:arsenical pump membrane protein